MAHKLKAFEQADAALGMHLIADRLTDQARRKFLAAAKAPDYQTTVELKQQGVDLERRAVTMRRRAECAESERAA